ncbi:MAG TPA: hypothetical protein VKZ41_10760 [Gemmatimonadales bacterium]|nr:hypothetical protein [Gemmatimonadales bacterium]
MEILEMLRTMDPRAMAMFAVVAIVGYGADRARVNRARRRVEDYLRSHRYTVKRIRRSRRPRLVSIESRHTVHFELDVFDLEFNIRRHGWASVPSSNATIFSGDVRVEWEGEPDDFGSALPPLN